MKKSTINTVIIIGILSIVSVMLVQIMWIKQAVRAQENMEILQRHQDSLFTRKFDKSVRVALRNVVEEIQQCDSMVSIDYGAVRQQSSNFFLVNLNDQLDAYYLEKLLERSFDANNVHQNFQYGLYDCYKDSVVYGRLIEYSKDSLFVVTNIDNIASPKVQKEIDGHYFTVYFPDALNYFEQDVINKKYPWVYVVIVVIVLLIFFAFSVSVIIQQKRMSVVRTDFVNNMTHELKTPIASIGLSSEMLKKADFSKDKERIHQYVDLIYRENNRLKKQVERVLNMARLDKNELDLIKEEVDVHQLIQKIVENLKLNFAHSFLKINIEQNAQSPVVKVDKVHFTNIFFNLFDNAIKYSKDKPVINVITKNRDNGILIIIKDEGIGIGKQEIKQIFDQFYRVNTGDLHDVKGFGLGLYYVQLIVNKHKGKISVQSRLGKGSTFKIWIPLVK